MTIQTPKDYLLVKDIADILKIGIKASRFLINDNKFKDYVISNGRILYIEKDIIIKEKAFLDNYIDVLSASKLIGCDEGTVRSYIRDGRIKDVIKYYDKKYRISLEEFEKVREFIIFEKEKIENRKSTDCLTRQIDELEEDFPLDNNTLGYMVEYLKYIYEISKDSSSCDKRIANIRRAMRILSKKMSCGLTQLTDFERNLILIDDGIPYGYKEDISRFFNYILSKHKSEIVYSESTKVYREKKSNSEQDKIYSLEELHKIKEYLVNIDKHINKAIKSRAYANKWLYSLLNMTFALRAQDIIKKIPNLELGLIGIYSMEWFQKNVFDLSMGLEVSKYLEESLSNEFAGKNSNRLVGVISTPLIIPISISYIINEIHRRNDKNKNIFPVESVFQHRSMEIFFKDIYPIKFSNKKSNKTLMTYSYAQQWEIGIDTYLSYSNATVLRSHIVNMHGVSNITHEYINPSYAGKIVNKVVYNLFCRGHFGLLYNCFINLLEPDNTYTFEEMTNNIKEFVEIINPLEIETISSVTRYKYKKISDLIDNYKKYDKSQIKELIYKVINGEMPSKNRNVQCLLGKDCAYYKREFCFGCEYSLVTMFSLNEIFTLLEDNIESLINEREIVYKKKYSKIIWDLVSLLNEFNRELERLGYDLNRFNKRQEDILIKVKELYMNKILFLG